MDSNLQIRASETGVPMAYIQLGTNVFIDPDLMTIMEKGDKKYVGLCSTNHKLELYYGDKRITDCSTCCTIFTYEERVQILEKKEHKCFLNTFYFRDTNKNTQFTGFVAEANEEESKDQDGVTDQGEDEEQFYLQELIPEEKDETEEDEYFELLSNYESVSEVQEHRRKEAEVEYANESISDLESEEEVEEESQYESDELVSEVQEHRRKEAEVEYANESISDLESEEEVEEESQYESDELVSEVQVRRRKEAEVEYANESNGLEFLTKRFKSCHEMNNESPTTIGTFSGSSIAHTPPPYDMTDYSTNLFVGDYLSMDTGDDEILLYTVIEIKMNTCTIESYGTYEVTEFKLEELSESFKKVNIT